MYKFLIGFIVAICGSALAQENSNPKGISEYWECGKSSYEPTLLIAYVRGKNKGGVNVIGTGEPQSATYYLEGLNRRWDFGPLVGKSRRFSLIIEPDGSGYYVDFVNGEPTKPSQVYRCKLSVN
jgi:hypothetical protein